MERLIKDASKMTDIQKKLNVSVKDGDMSFGNIVNAISVMQKKLDIAGTSAKEASTTIEGSTNMMKAAWDNLVTGIADDNADFDKLIDNFVESAGAMFDNLLPRILIAIQGIGKLIPELGAIILEHLPEIMETGQNIINGLIEAIIQALPTLIETGTQMLQSLLNGIIQYIPEIMPTVVKVILNLVKFIIDNLPKIVDTGIKILLELVNGIVQAIPELIPACVKAIGQIVDTLLDNLDEIIIAALDIIIALALGLVAALPELVAKIPTIIEKLTRALTDPTMLAKLIEAALQLIIALATGLITAIPVLLGKLPIIIASIATGLARSIIETDWGKLGRNILDGILNGLTNAGNAIKNAAKKLFKSIKNNIASLFGIHSPSTVMRDEIGKNLILGIGVSFDKDADMIDKDIKEFSDEIIDKMQNAVNLQTGAMAFSGTSGSVSQILSANSQFTGNINNVMTLDGEVVYENQQTIKARKELQYGGVK